MPSDSPAIALMGPHVGYAPTVAVVAEGLDAPVREQLISELIDADFVDNVRPGALRRGKPHARRGITCTVICRKAIDAVDALKEVKRLIRAFLARITAHAENVVERRQAASERRRTKRSQARDHRKARERRNGPKTLYGTHSLQAG